MSLKILHVYRVYGKHGINPVVQNQINNLRKNHQVDILEFKIKKGGVEYLKSIFKLATTIKKNKIQIVHSHYALCGLITFLTLTRKPKVCSLMGSDLLGKNLIAAICPFLSKICWNISIVKSKEMQSLISKSILIPNGVNFDIFYPINKSLALNKLGFDEKYINILFVATNPNAPVKNLKLAENTIENLNISSNIKAILHIVSYASPEELKIYYSASDVLLLTSISEGSPNVVKEALACNLPVVSTNVGDVKDVINNLEGCFIANSNPKDLADAIIKSFANKNEKNFRPFVNYLDSNIISQKITEIYNDL